MNDLLMDVEVQPFDYQYLSGLLRDYSYPRNKITKLLDSGDLIQLKRGMYVLSANYQKLLIPEVVANLLYGPSYISLDYALGYYHLIPELAFNITSVTTSRKKVYSTSIGTFSYQTIKPDYYRQGYLIHSLEGVNFLIATPEKALCDKLYLFPSQKSVAEMEIVLFDELRIDTDKFRSLNSRLIAEYSQNANSNNLRLLTAMVAK